MVIFQAPDGSQEFRQFESIDQVVTFVEDLRNTSGLDSAKIYRLEEVRFEFRPYYRVQMAAGGQAVADGDRELGASSSVSAGHRAAPQPEAVMSSAPAPLAAVPDARTPVASSSDAPSTPPSPVQHAPAPSAARPIDPVASVGRTQVAQPIAAPPVADPAPVPGPDRQMVSQQMADVSAFTPSFTDEGFRPEAVTSVEAEPGLGVRPATAETVAAAHSDAESGAPTLAAAKAEQPDDVAAEAGELDSSAQRFTSTAFGIDPPTTTRRGLFGR